jgi:hypothetical protein
MVIKISFENKSADIIDIIIEPEAVNFELGIGKSLEIELAYKPDHLDEKLETVMEKGRMIIYQNRCAMKIYIDNELKYW